MAVRREVHRHPAGRWPGRHGPGCRLDRPLPPTARSERSTVLGRIAAGFVRTRALLRRCGRGARPLVGALCPHGGTGGCGRPGRLRVSAGRPGPAHRRTADHRPRFRGQAAHARVREPRTAPTTRAPRTGARWWTDPPPRAAIPSRTAPAPTGVARPAPHSRKNSRNLVVGAWKRPSSMSRKGPLTRYLSWWRGQDLSWRPVRWCK